MEDPVRQERPPFCPIILRDRTLLVKARLKARKAVAKNNGVPSVETKVGLASPQHIETFCSGILGKPRVVERCWGKLSEP